MGNIGKKLLYGDDNRKEFSELSLPNSRKKQVWYLVLTRTNKLFLVNLLMFLFALPMIIWHILCETYLYTFGDITGENFYEYMQFLIYYDSSLRTILTVPAMLGIAGGLYVIRLMSWGEPVSLGYSFFRGIKLSAKQFTVVGLFTGVFMSLIEISVQFASCLLEGQMLQQSVAYGAILFSGILFSLVIMYLIPMLSTYNIRWLAAIKASVRFAIQFLGKNLRILLATIFPFAIFIVIGSPIFDLIPIGILGIFGFSYVILVIGLYTNQVFDEYINAQDYPEYYRRGLSKIQPEVQQGDVVSGKD